MADALTEIEMELAEANPEAIVYREYEEALIGVAERIGMDSVAAYDYEKCIEVLMKDNEWEYSEALEWFTVNTLGAHYGDGTPIFINTIKKEDE